MEKDTHKLVNYVCGSNIHNEGEDIKVDCSFIEITNYISNCLKREYVSTHKIISLTILCYFFQLKPESEYPDWLWEIHTGPPKKLEELDPNTKEYWRRVRKAAHRQHNRLEKTKRRYLY